VDFRAHTREEQYVHGGVTVLTESRRPTCMSSGGSGRLGGLAVENGVDTSRGAGDGYGVDFCVEAKSSPYEWRL